MCSRNLSQEASWLWLTSKLTLLTGCLAWMFTLQGGELCLLSFVPTTCVHIYLCCNTRVHISDFIYVRRTETTSRCTRCHPLEVVQYWRRPSTLCSRSDFYHLCQSYPLSLLSQGVNLSILSLSSACLCLVRVPIKPTCSWKQVRLAFAILNSCYWGNTESKNWN